MLLLNSHAETTLISGLIKGLLVSGWTIGSAITIWFLVSTAAKFTRNLNRWRTLGGRHQKTAEPFSIKDIRILKRFAEEVDFAEVPIKAEAILGFMVVLVLVSFWVTEGAIYLLRVDFATGTDRIGGSGVWIVSLFCSLFFGTLPYFYVLFRVQRKRHRISVKMIALVQNLIGNYQPRITIPEAIRRSAATMPDDIKGEWSRLALSLHIKKLDEALYEFAHRTDNIWAENLADTLMIAAEYGTDITESLQKMVKKMQTEKKHEEQRLAMITVYRIGTMILVAMNFVFIGINIWADGSNYHAYFVAPFGRFLVVLSLLVMFFSMIFVIRSGRRQF